MSPRDEFAAAALGGLLGLVRSSPGDEAIVRRAYELADEMIRQQKPSADDFKIFELACVAADAWAYENLHGDLTGEPSSELYDSMKRLEEATRPRQMRKVRP